MNVPRRSVLGALAGLLGIPYSGLAQEQTRPRLVDGHCPVCSMQGQQELSVNMTIKSYGFAGFIIDKPETPKVWLCQHCGCVFGMNTPAVAGGH